MPRSTTARKRVSRGGATLIALVALLLAAFLISFTLGRYGMPAGQVARILISRVLPLEKTWTDVMEAVVLRIRLPRILTACLVGGALSAAGAAYQGVFQNPMASPDVLGASGGAAFGAALAILLGGSSRAIALTAFAASVGAVALAALVAARAPGARPVALILAGMMTGSLFQAGTSCLKLVADPSNQLPAITYWLMGSLSGASAADLRFAAPPMALGFLLLLVPRWRLNVLALGDEEARALGVNARLLRLVAVCGATLLTAASVSLSGVIGWVGLVVPHLARGLVGSDYRRLLPASILAGAVFLLLVDDVSRNLLAVEIPIGILTAVIGAPFFLTLILRRERTL